MCAGNIVKCVLSRLHRTLETVKDDGEALALISRHPVREAPVDSCELVMRVDADDRCRACLDAQLAATTEVAARKTVLRARVAHIHVRTPNKVVRHCNRGGLESGREAPQRIGRQLPQACVPT